LAGKLLRIYLVGTPEGVVGTSVSIARREAEMFGTIVGALLTAVAILFIIACLLGAWIVHRERQAERLEERK
jgi:hypothetical protein